MSIYIKKKSLNLLLEKRGLIHLTIITITTHIKSTIKLGYYHTSPLYIIQYDNIIISFSLL